MVAVVGSALMPDVTMVDSPNGSGSTTAYAICPNGQTLIGGGFINFSASRLSYSAPGANIPVFWWQTETDSTNSFFSEALCTPSQTQDAAIGVYGNNMIPAHSTACAYATCPTGALMTGGGFKTGVGGYTYASYAVSTTQWIACGGNDTNSPVFVGSWGRCLPSSLWPTASVFNVEAYAWASPGTSGTAIAACPATSSVSGNGFSFDASSQYVMTESDAYHSWIGVLQTSSHASLKNNSTNSASLRAVATCLQL